MDLRRRQGGQKGSRVGNNPGHGAPAVELKLARKPKATTPTRAHLAVRVKQDVRRLAALHLGCSEEARRASTGQMEGRAYQR